MKSYLTRKSLIIGAVILLTGAVVAFANGGYWGQGGYGGHMTGYGSGYGMGPGMMGYGYGGGYGMGPGMMGYGPGYATGGRGYGANLTDEQRSKLDASQERFYTETQALRDKIQDQRNALQDALSTDNPDAAKVTKLQKELSTLEGEFNQKLVQHQLEVRGIVPENPNGGYSGYGQGYGGYCWQ